MKSFFRRFAKALPAFAALISVLAYGPATACTSFAIVAQDGALVYGRTMEWGSFDLRSRLVVIPREAPFQGSTPDGKAGFQWTAKYGAVALDMIEQDYFADGMNEAGLVVGVLYFPGFAEFQSYDPERAAISMSSIELAAYILTGFSSVDEVKPALEKLRIVPIPLPVLNNQPPPMHFTVIDRSGKGIVVEYVAGELHVYDNPLKVLTNSPGFDWHMTNLRNYVGLSAFALPARKLEGLNFTPIGAGSGFLGLPGDFTPPSRFVRAVAFTQTARQTADGEEAVYEALRILDNFNLPLPTAGSPDVDPLQQKDMRSSTIWSTVADTGNLVYYYHTQNNRMLRMVDLKRIDFAPNGEGLRRFPLDKTPSQAIDDVTPE